jgi:hypothetical protein
MGAALLVLLGLGCFIAGILTGMTWLYWACVASCAVAAVLLVVIRRRMVTEQPASAASSRPAAADGSAAAGTTTVERAGDGKATRVLPPEAPPSEALPSEAPPSEALPSGTLPSRAEAATGNGAAGAPAGLEDPPVEEVEVTDLLLVVDLKDEVFVIDEHPRYHVTGCAHVAGRSTIPLPLDEARADGFTPCAVCAPDRTLAQRARRRK